MSNSTRLVRIPSVSTSGDRTKNKNRVGRTLFLVSPLWRASLTGGGFFNCPHLFHFIEGGSQFFRRVGFIFEGPPPKNLGNRVRAGGNATGAVREAVADLL